LAADIGRLGAKGLRTKPQTTQTAMFSERKLILKALKVKGKEKLK
jgi:hypothetical protein